LAAALLQVAYYIVCAGPYQSAFDTVNVTSRIPDLLPVVFASIFVNVAAPTGCERRTSLPVVLVTMIRASSGDRLLLKYLRR